MQPEMQYVGEKPVDEITLDIYPTVEDGDFHFVMYEDDGETMDYQKGEYTTTRYDANVKYTGANRTLTLDIGERTGSYTDIAERDYLVKLHDGYMANASVIYDGAALTAYGSLEDLEAAETGYFMDSADRLCYVKVPDTAEAATIVIAGETVDRNIYEAEDGELLGNAAVDTDIDGFSGTGYVTGLAADGDGVTIGSVLVDAAVRYDLTIRYANSESEALTAHISADDGEGQQISFPATEGAWNETVSYTHLDVYKRQVKPLEGPVEGAGAVESRLVGDFLQVLVGIPQQHGRMPGPENIQVVAEAAADAGVEQPGQVVLMIPVPLGQGFDGQILQVVLL